MSRKPLRVAHIVESFSGGVNTYMQTVLPKLVENEFDVTLVCSLDRRDPANPRALSILRKAGVNVRVVSMARGINPAKDIAALFKLRTLLSRGRYDVIHTHGSKAGALGRLAARWVGAGVVMHTPHCFAFLRCQNRHLRPLYLYLERLLGRATTRLIAVSQSEATVAISNHIISHSKCVVVNNALDDDFLPSENTAASGCFPTRSAPASDPADLVVVTVCRLTAYKGIFRFLEMTRLLSRPHTVFLIAGDGELRHAVSQFITRWDLGDKVKLLGHVENVKPLYATADVVVLCSDAEGQPYSLLEAMRAKRAIVATRVPGNRELIVHDRTGWLAEPTPQGIAQAVASLLQDAPRRRYYGENAYAHFYLYHRLETQIARLAATYRTHADYCTKPADLLRCY